MTAASALQGDRWSRVRVRGRAVVLAVACTLVGVLAATGSAYAVTPFTAYVTNYGSNTVTPINVATNIAGSPINVGTEPWGIAITPDAKTAYVVNYGSNNVTPINIATNTAGSAIAVGNKPEEVAITPDGKTAYVVDTGSNSVTPINIVTNTAGSAIAVGNSPENIAITPDGKTAYVVNFGSNSVTPISIATSTAGTAITVGSQPTGIAITPDGKTAYVSNYGSNSVTPITIASNTAGSAIAIGNKPENVAVSPSGKTAYVAINNANEVTPIETATNTAGTPITVSSGPNTVAITPDGVSAYVSNTADNTVSPITLATSAVGPAIAVGSKPLQVAVTPDQAPVASFTVTPGIAGSSSSFNASGSTVAYGSITSYHWSFGDGESAETATPSTTHTYATAGEYTVTLSETDSAGTSTSKVFTGQTMGSNGGSSAQSSRGVTIVPPVPVNTGAPTITGTAQQGQKLTEHNGSWSNGPTNYTYQWLQCDSLGNGCLPIAGATGQIYAPVSEDVGHTIAVQETASNAGGSSNPAISAVTAVVVPPLPSSTAPPNISGLAQEGQTLTEGHGSWTNSPTGYGYQWLRCNGKGESCSAIAGATEQTYVPVNADLTHTIRVQETASNAGGSGGPAASAATAAVVPPGAPVNTGSPTISGTAEQGQTLTEHHGSWTNSPNGYAYQWLRCDGEGCAAIPGATAQTYVLVEADVADTLRVQEAASNEVGSGSPANSSATAVIVPPPPVNADAPTISGTAQQGQTLTEVHGTWTHNPTGYAYQWLRCNGNGESCAPIAGATGQTYVPVTEDVGHALSVTETASNAGGTSSPAASGTTAGVLPAHPQNIAAPTISGAAQLGQTLTEHSGTWTSNPTGFTYQWLRCGSNGETCAAIAGATGQTYSPGQADLGHELRLREGATNSGGAGSPAESSATAPVKPVLALTLPPSATTSDPAGPQPTDPSAAPPTAVVISAGAVTVTAHGEVVILLTCPRSALGGCKGTLTLALAAPHTRRSHARAARCTRGCRSLGSANYEARAGGKVRIRVHMASFGRKLLRQRKSLRVTVTATSVSAGHVATARRMITLRARRGA